jgi:hypothetical protein
MKKALVSLSILMTFCSFVIIPDFLPGKASYAALCQGNGSSETVERFISGYNMTLRIALWFIVIQTLIVLGLTYLPRRWSGEPPLTK